MGLSGLAQLNVELTSYCSKKTKCAFCAHQDLARNPSLTFGEMDFALLQSIRSQLETGPVISFHRDGDSCDYSQLGNALKLFAGFTTSIVTHGETLGAKADELIENVTTITVSVFRGDPDGPLQLASLKTFLVKKGDKAPQVQIKIVGDMSEEEIAPYEELGVRIVRRLIHVPIYNSKYAHRQPTIPEVGICLDALHRPTIDWKGDVFLCNRLDTERSLYLGSLRNGSLDSIWNGNIRKQMLHAHATGRRDLANPLCKVCTFWGVASE